MSDNKGHLQHQAFHDKKGSEGFYEGQKVKMTKESVAKTMKNALPTKKQAKAKKK